MNWKYVPFAGFFVFSCLVALFRYFLAPELSVSAHILWFIGQYIGLLIIWYSIRSIATYFDNRLPYTQGFSRRVAIQILSSFLIIVPPMILVYKGITPYLPAFFTRQFIGLTWILLSLMVVLMNVGIAAGFFFRNWQKTIQDKQAAEEAKLNAELELSYSKQKQAEIEMKALRAQMNPHFIFNSLNSINKYILKSDHINASRYLTRFAKLIRLILDNSNSKEVALSDELEALNLYIEMESLRFANKFKYKVLVDDNVGVDTLQVPPLIIQPYVENAIWHGLLHKESGGLLVVEVKKSADHELQFIIQDNGVGRARALELKSKSANANKSLGMKLTEERLNMLNQHTALNARIRILDLLDELEQPMGTKVILSIPI